MKTAKQVIVWRNDLKVRKGKMAAQVAHASLKIFLDKMSKFYEENHGRLMDSSVIRELFRPYSNDPENVAKIFTYRIDDPVDLWLDGSFTKIVLKVNSEKELHDIFLKSKENNLPSCIIIDNGKTEFNGVPTATCVAIGPAWSEDIDKITGHLELM